MKMFNLKERIYHARAWEGECDRLQIPFIFIIEHGKYSSVKWDLIGFEKRMTWTRGEEDLILDKIVEINKKYSCQKKFTLSVCIAEIKKIPTERARSCAQELHDLFTGATP